MLTYLRMLCLVGMFAIWGCTSARTDSLLTTDEISQKIAVFHRQPTQEEFSGILAGFAHLDDDQMMQENASLMAAFVLYATDRYSVRVDGAPDSTPLRRFHSANKAQFRAWVDDASVSPEKNDVLWMGYFVTGDDAYLDRILAVAEADASQIAEGKDLVFDMAGSTAKWSYKSNVKQWPEVLRHAQRMAATGHRFAAECIVNAEKN